MHYSTDLHFPIQDGEEIKVDIDWHEYEGFNEGLDMWQAKWELADAQDEKGASLILHVAPPYSWLFGITSEKQMVKIGAEAADDVYKKIALYNSVIGDSEVPFEGDVEDEMKILFWRDKEFDVEEYFGKSILPEAVFGHVKFWCETNTPVCACVARELDAETPDGTIARITCGDRDPEAWMLEQVAESIIPLGEEFDAVGWADLDAAFELPTLTLALLGQAALIDGNWMIMILARSILEQDEDQAAKERLYTAAYALCSVTSVRETASTLAQAAFDRW